MFIMAKILPLGKLKYNLLEEFLQKYRGIEDKRLIVGPKIGEDAAIISLPDRYLVAKSDPVTFATDEIGWYAVNVNANDIAVRGARPRWFQSTILLPEEKTTKDLVEKVFSQISLACKELKVAIVGGHTEVSHNLKQPIVVGCMFGEVKKERLITTSGAKVGDDILLTKGIVIEGTSILAREKEEELRQRGYSHDFIRRSKDYLHNPGISVVKDALLANKYKVSSMHDPTEGGLATGLYEIARASQVGMLIYAQKIPILPESKILCQEFGLNPLGTITSGTLLLTTKTENSKKILKTYKTKGIKASLIGKVKDKTCGIKIEVDGKITNLKYSEKDEITKLWD